MPGLIERTGGGRALYGCTEFYGPAPSWSACGHPELEGEPTIMTMAGPVKVPPKPPAPGPRFGGGRVAGKE